MCIYIYIYICVCVCGVCVSINIYIYIYNKKNLSKKCVYNKIDISTAVNVTTDRKAKNRRLGQWYARDLLTS